MPAAAAACRRCSCALDAILSGRGRRLAALLSSLGQGQWCFLLCLLPLLLSLLLFHIVLHLLAFLLRVQHVRAGRQLDGVRRQVGNVTLRIQLAEAGMHLLQRKAKSKA
jgi:hypothetical protein